MRQPSAKHNLPVTSDALARTPRLVRRDSMTRFNMCVCAMALLSSACVGTSGSGAASNAPVNFGMPMGYTGRLSVVGDSWLKGGQAGADVVNSSGGVNGQKVKIVPVDTALDPVDAVTATRKMLAVDNVKVSIGLIALDYPNALPILNQSKMVSFTIIGDPAIDQMVMPYSFSLRVSAALEGTAMVALAKKRGYHNIAVVFDSSASAQAFPPSLKFAASKAGLNIVAEPLVPQTAPSYEAVIDQVLQAHPDVVMMQIESNQAGTFFDEWRKLGGTSLPIISSDITVTPEWTKPAGAYELRHITAIQTTSNPTGTSQDRST